MTSKLPIESSAETASRLGLPMEREHRVALEQPMTLREGESTMELGVEGAHMAAFWYFSGVVTIFSLLQPADARVHSGRVRPARPSRHASARTSPSPLVL
jgi:hypothetical protein